MPNLYNPAVPTGLIELDEDYINLQNNFQQLDTTFKVDHVPLTNSTSINGYHTIIHQPPNGGAVPVDPLPIAGINQLYAKNVTLNAVTDTQLFNMTGLGVIRQLTGGNPAQFVSATNGYQYIGGILVQWGTVVNAVKQSNTILVLPIPFPNKNLGVFTNLQKDTAQNDADNVYALLLTNANFTYFSTSGSTTRTFNWFAIGN